MSIHSLDIKEKHGNVTLSIVAGHYAYSTPRDHASEYSSVEIALIKSNELVRPEATGITDPELVALWEEGGSPVAGYVPWNMVNRVRAALDAPNDTSDTARAALGAARSEEGQ